MTELNKKHEPNGTKEEVTLGILHNVNGYYVSNEGTKNKPNYHVWCYAVVLMPYSPCCKLYGDLLSTEL